MTTEETKQPAVVLSTAMLERINDLAEWFTDNPNHSDIKDGLCVLVRDVAFAERDACAKVAEEFDGRHGHDGACVIAEAIRLRSNAKLSGCPAEHNE